MSHEILNPLGAVIGMAQTLEKPRLDKEQRQYLRSIRIASNNLLSILTDVLDFLRLETGQAEVVYHNFDIREAVAEVAELFGPQAMERNILFQTHYDGDLPNTVYSDKQKIQQALNNLVSNAVKFTANGKVDIVVTTEMDASGESFLSLKVEDTGKGVPTEDIPKMFESFRQLDASTKKESRGTGLGLSIVRGLVALLGGGVDFLSEPGKGSQAVFTVPLPRGEVIMAVDRRQGGCNDRMKLLRVLVVEDDAINQMYLTNFLRRQGWDVDSAYNGLAALELFRGNSYDLILMDGQMPRMDGFETARKIREIETHRKRTPMVAISGYAIPGDRERFIEAGMDDYLAKPIEERRLMEVIRRLILS